MKRNSHNRKVAYLRVICTTLALGMAWPLSVQAGHVKLATSPLANSTAGSVKPNILFVLDDSGSMDRAYSPDWASTSTIYLARNAAYNGVAYNPSVKYLPPTMYTAAGVLHSTLPVASQTYPSMIGTSTATGANTANPMPNWERVKFDGFGIQTNAGSECPDGAGGTTCNVSSTATDSANFFTFIPGEYCKLPDLKECSVLPAATATYPYPATLRWCSSSALTSSTCRAAHSDAVYKYPRYPTPRATTITFSSLSGTPSITSFKVGSKEIMSGPASATTAANLAIAVRQKINDCNVALVGNCEVKGFGATSSSGNVTIYAGAGSVTSPVVSKTGTVSISDSTPSFTRLGSGALTSTPGFNLMTVIRPGATARYYPLTSDTATRAATRTECATVAASTGTIQCTGNEELINYANWFAYYHTRMQMMKTGVSNAFKNLDSRYRVGLNTIHYTGSANDANAKFLNVRDFDATQKYNWYVKLFSQLPDDGTPLRSALSKAGRYFANKITGQTEPMQYACQRNFTLLTTDGYWNTDAATDIKAVDGIALIGNMDGPGTLRPYFEGSPTVTASSGSLADVARYYLNTDIRTDGLGNCNSILTGENVCGTPAEFPLQNMVTFTLGLGVDGSLQFQSDYKTAPYGDYYDILNGAAGANWPRPVADTDTAVDDLWHAAVNGGGTYFSAKDPATLSSGLAAALAEMDSVVGSGAAAATSSYTPTQGDNYIYMATYTTVDWTGNLVALTLDLHNGQPSTAPAWCAENVVDPVTDSITCTGKMASRQLSPSSDNRKILFNNNGTLAEFTYANLSSAGKSSYFDTAWVTPRLSQWNYLDPATQQPNAVGANLVKYLRGNTEYDMNSAIPAKRLFRARKATLGDAFESQPAFIGAPLYNYSDAGFSAFKAAKANRAKTIYVGMNDGMLHAFNASGDPLDPQQGQERWAYIPSMVIPKMAKLADSNYATSHANFVNGNPYIGEVYDGSNWRTILVAGLNGGGRGYFALDITDPDNPSLLWEKDPSSPGFASLGYSFGFPVVTKMNNGTWVVALTSGYNNGTLDSDETAYATPGDGKGHLYVVNAITGALIKTLDTTAGTPASPSGFAKAISWVDDFMVNNTASFIYGGDLEGNVWRFDINAAASATNPFRVAVLRDSSSNVQPITTQPDLAFLNNQRMLFIGTGKYLEPSDLLTTQQQTMYAISDDQSASPTTLYAPNGTMVQQTFTNINGNTERSVTANPVDLYSQRGWYINLPDSGERINVNPTFFYGMVLFPSLVPSATLCSPGGYGWLNFVGATNGHKVPNATIAGIRTGVPIVGPPLKVKMPCLGAGDVCGEVTLVPGADGKVRNIGGVPQGGGGSSDFEGHQTIWRIMKNN